MDSIRASKNVTEHPAVGGTNHKINSSYCTDDNKYFENFLN
jgi:hypothetical protein